MVLPAQFCGVKNDPPRRPRCRHRQRLSNSDYSKDAIRRVARWSRRCPLIRSDAFATLQERLCRPAGRNKDRRTEVSPVQQVVFVTLALLAPICAARRPIAWFARSRRMKRGWLRADRRQNFRPPADVRSVTRSVDRRPRRIAPGRKTDLVGSRSISESAQYAKWRPPVAS